MFGLTFRNITITFSIPSKSIVSVKLFDLVGKEICEIGGKSMLPVRMGWI